MLSTGSILVWLHTQVTLDCVPYTAQSPVFLKLLEPQGLCTCGLAALHHRLHRPCWPGCLLRVLQVLVQGPHGRCLALGLAQPALGIWLMGRCHSPPVCSAAPCSSLCSYHPQAAETEAENTCVRRPSRELTPRPSLSSLPLPAPGGAVAVAHRGPAALAARWLRSLQHRHVSADLVLCLRPWRPWTTASPT